MFLIPCADIADCHNSISMLVESQARAQSRLAARRTRPGTPTVLSQFSIPVIRVCVQDRETLRVNFS